MTIWSILILTAIGLALGYALLAGAVSGGIRHAQERREARDRKDDDRMS